MNDAVFHVVTTVSNPVRWDSRIKLARRAIMGWIDEPNVHVTLVEVAHGARDYELADLGNHPQITHIPVRAYTLAWSKENCLNIGISRLPQNAKYIGTFDADIHFRKRGWAAETIHALQIYPVVQPFKNCYDLGPDDDHVQVHKSFASQFHSGQPVVPKNQKWWDFNGGPYHYPHCLAPGSFVVPGGNVLAASSRPFKGDLVIIRTASGKEISCTPNHPVLTNSGWVRADKFKVGDDVFRYLRRDSIPGHINKKDVPVRIENIVCAFSERSGMCRTAVQLPDYLDNNRADCKVASVWSDGLLSDMDDSHVSQENRDLSFSNIGLESKSLNRSSMEAFLLEGINLSASSDETAFSPTLLSKFGSQFFEHSFTDSGSNFLSSDFGGFVPRLFSPNSNSNGRESFSNFYRNSIVDKLSGVPLVHADNLGAFRSALAGKVEADEVVYVGRREFDGQVYDLQTENGYMVNDDIIVHNSGFLWAWVREILDRIGGLFEYGGMGSGDHHQALGLIGHADYSLTKGIGQEYRNAVKTWESRALTHVNKKIGYVPNTIEHFFHGDKDNRKYVDRWQMFIKHDFNPYCDLKKNSYGVLEFAGNKPGLEREFDNYLRDRREDDNSIG